jgi:hypothetical protein
VILFRTERPILLPREEETHDWFERERPWERFGLTHILDREPGDWRHYSTAFRAVWARAKAEETGFINAESDVVPTLEAFREILECPEDVCTVPYAIYEYHNSSSFAGWSAVIEQRVPGGWDSRFARPGDQWAASCDLGFVKFGPRTVAKMDLARLPPITHDDGQLHSEVWWWIGKVSPPGRVVHLHFPGGTGLQNNHTVWDDGDQRHHPPGFKPVVPTP